MTINTVDMPGGPAFVARMMQGKTTRVKQCLTAADAARGPQEMLKSAKGCAFTRYSMANGRMNSELTCSQGGQKTTSVTTGSFTPTSFTSSARSVTTGQMPMTMTSTANGKLIGPCK